MIECSGRTQVSLPEPQRIDFGHGKSRTTSGIISAITSMAGLPGLLGHRDVEVALLVGLHLGLIDRGQARRAQETGDGLLGRADLRALALFLQVGLARRHAVHRQRQAARRHKGLGALIGEAGRHQPVGDHFPQIVGRARLHARGDFLGEQFEQEIGHVGQSLNRGSNSALA